MPPTFPPSPSTRRRLAGWLLALLCVCGHSAIRPASAQPASGRPTGPAAARPKDPFTRGLELFRQGKLDEAITALREAEAADPRDAVTQNWLGFILFRARRYDESIRSLRRALELNASNPDTYNNLGNAYLAKGDLAAAIEQYRQAVDLVKDQPGKHGDLYYNLGNALVRKGDLDDALQAFLKAEQANPKDALVQNNLGYLYERKHALNPEQNPISAAVDRYKRATELDPNSPVFARNLGLAARKMQGQPELALRALRRAIQLDPKDYASHVALAEELQNGNQIAQSISEYRIAAQLRPNEFVPRYNLGLLLVRLPSPNYAEALTQLQQAIKIRPSDHRALSALGYVCYKANRIDDAEKYYRQAVKSAPDNASSHANLGLALDRLGRVPEAIAAWKEALKLDPADNATRSMLGSAYLNQRKYAEAAAEYGEIVRRDPRDAGAQNNLGYAYEKLGKINEAILAYKAAIESNPRLAVAYNNLGACYERTGQKELARQNYQRALQVDPSNAEAKKNLARLGAAG